jgi:hypothetical protein
MGRGGIVLGRIIIDLHINNGTKIAVTLDPFTLYPLPWERGEGKGGARKTEKEKK